MWFPQLWSGEINGKAPHYGVLFLGILISKIPEMHTISNPRVRITVFGRSVGIRTRGLLDPNQARYQASPHPVSLNIIMKKYANVKGFPVFFEKRNESAGASVKCL